MGTTEKEFKEQFEKDLMEQFRKEEKHFLNSIMPQIRRDLPKIKRNPNKPYTVTFTLDVAQFLKFREAKRKRLKEK